MLAGYVVAAIGWGFRVELKLARLDQDAKASKALQDEMRLDIKTLVADSAKARIHEARSDAALGEIKALLERDDRR